MDIIRYDDSLEEKWDKFVCDGSVNGTFLQTRLFLNYHPKDRFKDCSLIFYRKDLYNIYAVVPACEFIEDGRKVFCSHKGSTFGGLIVCKNRYNAQDVTDIIDCLNEWLESNGYDRAELKMTPDLFSASRTDLLQYLLWNKGYKQYTELSAYIDFSGYPQDILLGFESGKRGHVGKCNRYALCGRVLNGQNEIEAFYELLCDNLAKHDAKPVHTVAELSDLKHRLQDIITFYGVFDKDIMVAGSMLFYFASTNTCHTQYLCARQADSSYSPMPFLVYKLLEYAKMQDAKCFSFGTSTLDKGKTLNVGLIKAKEEYGSDYSLNRVFYRDIR